MDSSSKTEATPGTDHTVASARSWSWSEGAVPVSVTSPRHAWTATPELNCWSCALSVTNRF